MDAKVVYVSVVECGVAIVAAFVVYAVVVVTVVAVVVFGSVSK